MTTVLLVDDDALVRGGLRALLHAEPDLDVVGEAADGAVGVDLARRLRPDVVVMDIRMPGRDGTSATREIVSWASPRPFVLVLTTFDLDDVVDDAIAAGADGFLLKRATPDELVAGIRTVAAGDALLSPAVTRRLFRLHARRRPADHDVTLTGREADVLRSLAAGGTTTEIAAAMFISAETVRTHVKHLLAKLGVRDRTQAVVWAYRSGFMDRASGGEGAPYPEPGGSR
ncbi:response regulator [Myceligenerans xiligouense]|uniref:LuxR family two component transcriptional regulator n=1 Tax=Myceligenerans xiligouense TaxID=253184 RepID=A0A3N4Z6I6_9MICO|nr:response regulator transcription factor [Myceligenerans xiligouense]RPF20902.1 LuxR family two component transcriptional regulator [Myceligenerans xiligouense]